jgi:exonuclease SbcC
VRTLSGGETFLASLALALALADQVAELARGGGGDVGAGGTGAASGAGRAGPVGVRARSSRLESIFLDEGFGTLDPETLDTVAGAIEELSSLGRMVGVVSHVRDLAERLPLRFEVTRGPAGATVTRLDGR